MATRIRIKIKTGDTVAVLAGKDRGKQGKVTQVLPAAGRLVVDGVNKTIKHLRSRGEGAKGQKVEFWGPIAVSNVALVCPKCGKKTRVGMKTLADGKKTRVCRKCKETL